LDQLIDLYRRAFGRAISQEQWLWKLGSWRAGVANVWVAEVNGRIVFQYAGIPTRVRHRGTESWAMVSVDTMTHPEYRRRGLLGEVGATTYARWKEAGIAYVVGAPNERWGSRLNVLGITPVAELGWWVRWLDPFRILAARAGLRWSRSGPRPRATPTANLRVSVIDDPTPFDELWQRTGEEGVVRDAAWFRWRYLDAVPKSIVLGAWQSGHLVGGVAFHVDEDRGLPSGIISEVVGSTFPVLRLLLVQSCQYLRAMGAVRAALLVQRGSTLEEAALATGFLPRRSGFCVQAADLGGGLPRAAVFHGGDFDVA
jgi:hypothetical protein